LTDDGEYARLKNTYFTWEVIYPLHHLWISRQGRQAAWPATWSTNFNFINTSIGLHRVGSTVFKIIRFRKHHSMRIEVILVAFYPLCMPTPACAGFSFSRRGCQHRAMARTIGKHAKPCFYLPPLRSLSLRLCTLLRWSLSLIICFLLVFVLQDYRLPVWFSSARFLADMSLVEFLTIVCKLFFSSRTAVGLIDPLNSLPETP